MQKSKTALENMKELILLDLKIVLFAYIAWQHSGKQPDAELATAAQPSGGNILRAAQQRESVQTPGPLRPRLRPPSTGPTAFSDEEQD